METSPGNSPGGMPPGKQIRLVGAAVLVIALVLILVRVVPGLFAPKPPPPEAPPPAGFFRPTDDEWTSLTVAPVNRVHFADVIDTDGIVAADDDATTPVFSPFSGRVSRIFARAGDAVAKGAPLFAIDASEFVQAQNDLVSAEAALETARKQLDLARTNEKRQEGLYAAKGGALKDLEQSRVDLATAEGGLRTAEIAVTAVRGRLRILGMGDDQIDGMAGSRDPVKWSPEATVSAPIAGVVTQRQVGPGQNVVSVASGGSNPLFTIADTSKVWLTAFVSEADAPKVRVGDEVEARALAYPGRVFQGKLDSVAAGLDPATRRLFVRSQIENPDGALKLQMFADFRIVTGDERDSPAVPTEAVIYEGPAARVWAVGPGRTVGLKEIRVGATEDGRVEVLSGLSAGDSVISSGSLFIDRAATAE